MHSCDITTQEKKDPSSDLGLVHFHNIQLILGGYLLAATAHNRVGNRRILPALLSLLDEVHHAQTCIESVGMPSERVEVDF